MPLIAGAPATTFVAGLLYIHPDGGLAMTADAGCTANR